MTSRQWKFEVGDTARDPDSANPESVFFVSLWYYGRLVYEQGYIATLTDSEVRAAKLIAAQMVRRDMEYDLDELERLAGWIDNTPEDK